MKFPFLRSVQKETKPHFGTHGINSGMGLSGLHVGKKGVIHALSTTGKPIIRLADGGLLPRILGDENGIVNLAPDTVADTSSALQAISPANLDDPKKFLGMSGKDWLKLGLGAVAGTVGSMGGGGAPGFTSLYNPSIGAIHKAEGGSMAEGSAPAQPQATPEDVQNQQIFQAAVEALTGKSRNPQEAILQFVQHFGKEALAELQQKVSGGLSQAQPVPAQANMASGGLLSGPGDGQSDSIRASHSGTGQPIQLGDGEYVIKAPAVAALGNGSTAAGARKLDAGIAGLMQRTYGRVKNPKALKPNENPILG